MVANKQEVCLLCTCTCHLEHFSTEQRKLLKGTHKLSRRKQNNKSTRAKIILQLLNLTPHIPGRKKGVGGGEGSCDWTAMSVVPHGHHRALCHELYNYILTCWPSQKTFSVNLRANQGAKSSVLMAGTAFLGGEQALYMGAYVQVCSLEGGLGVLPQNILEFQVVRECISHHLKPLYK